MNGRSTAFLLASVAALFLLFSAPTVAASDAVVAQEVETEMETSSEPVEVLVTLEDPSPTTGGLTTMEDRKRETGRSQRALARYAESKEEVRVLKEFWITNAVLLEVEPGVGYKTLVNVDGVTSVRSNTETEVLGSPSRTLSQSHAGAGAVTGTAPTTAQTTTRTQSTLPYGVEQINAPEVWSQHGTKGGGVNVAVLDTGVNVSHPDIDLRTTDPSDPTYPGGWAEFDSQGNRVTGSEPHDTDGHGTHVSGTVAGEKTGVAPDANLMHALVVNGNRGTVAQALSGMEWAVENDADVVTMSLGGQTESAWIDAVEAANSMGVVVVAASGNGGDGTSASPGNVHDVLSAGAVDSNLNVASFSGGEAIDTDDFWGNSAPADWPSEYVVPDIVAAGVGVNSTSADDGYGFKSGTSMAAPHVAGAVALAKSASGGSTVVETGNAFRFTAFGSGSEESGKRHGYGAADALAATGVLLDGASVSGTVVDGSRDPIQDAELRVNNVHARTNGGDYSVELAEGSWTLEASAPGYETTTKTVSLSRDENADVNVVLGKPDPAFFEVSSLTGPAEAEPGETVTVTAEVRNTGDEQGAQDVTLRLAGEGGALDGSAVVATRSDLTLAGGESKTVGFSLEVPDEEGSYDYGVFTGDDSATGSLTVREAEPPFFEVSGMNGQSEAEPNESVDVRATVRNSGGSTGTKTVTLRLAEEGEPLDEGAVVGSSDLSLGAGSSLTVAFTVEAPGEEGRYGYGVFTDDDNETATLTVEEPDTVQAFFEVDGLNAPAEVEAEENASVNATVRNTGDVSGTQDVTFRLNESGEPLDDGSVAATDDGVNLGAGSETMVEFTVTAPDVQGDYDHGIFTENGSATGAITVVQSDEFDLDSYRNGDGRVDTAGLQAAINDFLGGDIRTGDLQAVIKAFIEARAS